LFRRKVIAKTGLFDEKLLRRQDTDYLIRVLLNGHRFLYVGDATIYYTRHGGEHIGNPQNYDNHFLSSLWVVENAYSFLSAKGQVDQYSKEINNYLIRLACEARYIGYHRGVALTEEINKRWFNRDLGEYNLNFGIFQMRLKRKLVKMAKHLLGDCALDWINKSVCKGVEG